MSAAALTASEIADTIMQALVRTRTRFRLTVEESCAIGEGLRRIDQYEFLPANVIPDLQRRLDAADARRAPI
jgi:hypothetical protein